MAASRGFFVEKYTKLILETFILIFFIFVPWKRCRYAVPARSVWLLEVRKMEAGHGNLLQSFMVNDGRTKVMRCRVSKGQVKASRRDSCSVYRKSRRCVANNSILCMECHISGHNTEKD